MCMCFISQHITIPYHSKLIKFFTVVEPRSVTVRDSSPSHFYEFHFQKRIGIAMLKCLHYCFRGSGKCISNPANSFLLLQILRCGKARCGIRGEKNVPGKM
jgi:hypothetical protein